uniref:Uncharacterized protein n=1 Tax=Hordeum vulgare subsp. vulgare TaxID=112509 RepID=A0A8I6X4E7_HORVV
MACCARTSCRSPWPASSWSTASLTTSTCRRRSSRVPPSWIQGNLGYVDDVHDSWSHMTGHCNGLLLWGGVANPATRQWVSLPRPDRIRIKGFIERDWLAFDPTVSPHFEVFFMHCVSRRYENQAELVPANPNSEWPPSPYIISAFSSETWRWEQRSFVREGTVPRSIDPKLLPLMKDVFSRHAVYWRGRLYVYNIFFIIRLDLEDNKYRVIQLPPTINEAPGDILPHLGKSEKGVYYGFAHSNWCNFQVWFLNESIDHIEWMLKLEIDLKPLLENFPWEYSHGSWFVQGVRDYDDETLDEEKTFSPNYITSILGFYPYKEIIFLRTSHMRAMAYHLSSSKVEDLGCLSLAGDDSIKASFVYTPCFFFFEKEDEPPASAS